MDKLRLCSLSLAQKLTYTATKINPFIFRSMSLSARQGIIVKCIPTWLYVCICLYAVCMSNVSLAIQTIYYINLHSHDRCGGEDLMSYVILLSYTYKPYPSYSYVQKRFYIILNETKPTVYEISRDFLKPPNSSKLKFIQS